MALVENLVVATYIVLTLLVALAAWRAWWYTRTTKVMLLALAFAALFVKAVFLAIGLFTIPEWHRLFVPSLLVDLFVIVLFYVAVLRRSS